MKETKMTDIITQLEKEQAARLSSKIIQKFKVGDKVKVHVKVKDGTRERLQVFEGDVIAKVNRGVSSNFTVRKVSFGEGVERVFPLYSPLVAKIEVARYGKVRRAKLYYMRDRKGKSARITEDTSARDKRKRQE